MNDIIIYGASDDLVEVEGLVRDEKSLYDCPALVTVKVDDTIWAQVPIHYDDEGVWRVGVGVATQAPATFVPARGEDAGNDEHGCPGYSEKVIVGMGDIEARRVVVKIKKVR